MLDIMMESFCRRFNSLADGKAPMPILFYPTQPHTLSMYFDIACIIARPVKCHLLKGI
jgi:hypothetical protein